MSLDGMYAQTLANLTGGTDPNCPRCHGTGIAISKTEIIGGLSVGSGMEQCPACNMNRLAPEDMAHA